MDVWCAIRTYPKHATELGNPIPDEPVFFLKPSSSVVEFGEIDACGGDVHHEIELVLKLGEGLNPTHMALGLDLTKRSIQDMLKEKRLPWAEAKAFTGAAVLGEWVEFDERASFQLEVNRKTTQIGSLANMSFSIDELISKLADWAPIKSGDILFTGTPSGVGPLNAGDEVTALLYVDSEVVSTHYATCV
ncbi:MAG: fumarylacetoacetate hydrolase family protein [Candidatus Poseidoniaceae archaeon]|jgi:2-keto-4-pentenoate hydratase/2-oxohepta-3-ene-1,7-dioic acid hydratase in catechol pathway|nr:fumarylacetoacetate hydrolase family protein [Candidatus Poseidoniaceae archaeon]